MKGVSLPCKENLAEPALQVGVTRLVGEVNSVPSRNEQRDMFTDDVRIRLLEQDADRHDEIIKTMHEEMKVEIGKVNRVLVKILWTLIGLLIALIASSIVIAVRATLQLP